MNLTSACSLVVILTWSITARATVTFDWADVGNPGNAGELSGTAYPAIVGSVDYSYRISKHEVTNAQYAEFLNAVDAGGVNAFSLYAPEMSTDARGGIMLNGNAANGAKYEIKPGRGNNPVVYIDFRDALRFVNWLENGQGSGGTESGVYTIGSGLNETRSPSATYFLPSEDEWYKAAYHKNDGVTGNYWDYPTVTNAVPYSDQPPGSDAPEQSKTGNFWKYDSRTNGYDEGYAVSAMPTFDNSVNYLTDVGAYTASLSPYGTFDQGGNAWEWTEAIIDSNKRNLRGGGWIASVDFLRASYRGGTDPTLTGNATGFRVASVPEPGCLRWVGATAMMILALRNKPRY